MMFQWQKEMDRLELQVKQIHNLQRSLNRIQLGLAGYPSQEATAYICLFAAGKGVRAAVVLHLHASDRLAIYLNEEGEMARNQGDSLVRSAAGFVESMGFMVSELDWAILSQEGKSALWASLPLKGRPRPAPAPVKAPPAGQPGPPPETKEQKKPSPAATAASPPPQPAPPQAQAQAQESEDLPAKPEGKAGAPSKEKTAEPQEQSLPADEVPLPFPTRHLRQAPTTEAMDARRQKLRENVGRFLASL